MSVVNDRRTAFGRVLLRLLPLVAVIGLGIGAQIYILFEMAREGLRQLGLPEETVRAYEQYMGQTSVAVFLASAFLVVAIAGLIALRQAMRYVEEEQQAQAKRLEMLEELDRVKDQVLQIVSHELRTPLTFVVAYSELLKERQLEPSTVREMASELHGGAQRLSETVQKLLRASELRLAARPVKPAAFDLRPLLRDTVDAWASSAPVGSIVLEIDDDLPPVLADREYFTQALGNLLSNAVKHAPAGTSIAVSAQVSGRRVSVEVADCGVGIPADEQAKLFVPFGRTSLSESRCEPGSGLGLFITRRLVELQGGRIWLRSAPERGCTFGFDLPVAREEFVGKRRPEVVDKVLSGV